LVIISNERGETNHLWSLLILFITEKGKGIIFLKRKRSEKIVIPKPKILQLRINKTKKKKLTNQIIKKKKKAILLLTNQVHYKIVIKKITKIFIME